MKASCFGDAARREVLIAAGLMRANALVVSYADTASAMRILGLVQELRPGLAVVVRTLDDSDIDQLKQAGAAEVVAEILEGSLMLATHALMLLGVPFNRVLRRIRETREHRYGLFRGFYRGVTDEEDDEGDRLAGAPALRPDPAGRGIDRQDAGGAQSCAVRCRGNRNPAAQYS